VKKTSAGQSLVEVVVAIGVMSLLLMALLALVSLSVKNSRVARDRSKAVALAQQGVELMRTYRDYSYTLLAAAAGETYVLAANWAVEDGLVTAGCDETSFMDETDYFSRCVRVIMVEPSQVEVAVTVYWQEGNKLNATEQTTRLSSWQI